MNWNALFSALPPIPLHALMAIACLAAGSIQLLARKGTKPHRILGWIWVLAMAFVGISGLFIWEIRLVWLFSPIHLLSLWLLFNLYRAVRDARLGNVEAHAKNMRSMFWLALVVTGAFTFLPGRVMFNVFF